MQMNDGFKKRLNLRKYLSLLVLTLLFVPFQNCTGGFSTNGVQSSIDTPTDPIPEPEDPDEPAITITAPTNLRSGNITTSQIQLSWNDNSNNEAGFYIERATSSGGTYSQIAMVNSSISTFTVTPLNSGTTYWFRVRAHNNGTYSGYSNVLSATTTAVVTPQPPAAPTNLAATATSTTQINLSWTDASNNEQGFYIEQRLGSSGNFSQIAQVNANVTTYSNSGLIANTAYSYRVRAFNADGNSNYSSVVSATTQNTTPPPSSNMKQVFMAQGHLGRTIMSCDGGLTWINDRSDNPNGRCWQNGANYVECDHTPITGRGLDAGDGYFYANFGWGAPGTVRRSVDGVNWTTIRNSGGNGDGILYYDGRLWSSWGTYNSAYSDDNGLTWTTNPAHTNLEHQLGHRAGNLFFAVSRDRAGLSISQNGGQSWQYRSEFPHGSALFFAYGNNIHLMVGGSSATRSLDNGTTWTRNASAITGSFIGLSFNGTHFVGFTSSARWMSTDGVTWSQTAINNRGSGTVTLNKPIAYNPETQTYVAVPEFWVAGYSDQRALHSTDGINWTVLSSTAFPQGHPITRIVSGPMDARHCP